MAYILTAELDAEDRPGTAFARYQGYIASVRDRLPPGALRLATADWYFNSSDHRAPHDARLDAVTVTESAAAGEPPSAPRSVSIAVRLLGAYHDGHIELRYRGVTRYRIELRSPEPDARPWGHRDWRYDEFRLAPGGRVEHEIEWWGPWPTGTWLIEAADVEYAWRALSTEG